MHLTTLPLLSHRSRAITIDHRKHLSAMVLPVADSVGKVRLSSYFAFDGHPPFRILSSWLESFCRARGFSTDMLARITTATAHLVDVCFESSGLSTQENEDGESSLASSFSVCCNHSLNFVLE